MPKAGHRFVELWRRKLCFCCGRRDRDGTFPNFIKWRLSWYLLLEFFFCAFSLQIWFSPFAFPHVLLGTGERQTGEANGWHCAGVINFVSHFWRGRDVFLGYQTRHLRCSSIIALLTWRYLVFKLSGQAWCHLRFYCARRVLREWTPQILRSGRTAVTQSGCKHYLVLIARQLLDNSFELGSLLPGACKSWLSWSWQNLTGEKELSFGPRKTALKRRLQRSEPVFVLLLKAECFYKVVFGPGLPSRCQTYLSVGEADKKWDCWCGHGIGGSRRSAVGQVSTAAWAWHESYLLLCSGCSGQLYSTEWFCYPFHAAASGGWRAEGRPWEFFADPRQYHHRLLFGRLRFQWFSFSTEFISESWVMPFLCPVSDFEGILPCAGRRMRSEAGCPPA